MEDTGAVELQITYPDQDTAREAAGQMVQARLAACAQITKVRSVYMWEGKTEDETEALLTLKTTRACLPALERNIRETHSYDVPQMTALSITWAAQDYLDWVRDQCVPRD